MSDSERSFVDRVQKARSLHDACAGFTPVYAPPPQGVMLPAYFVKITACDAHNNAARDALVPWQEVVEMRSDTADTIKKTTTQLINYIKGSAAWRSKYTAAKRFADAIRGMKPPRKPALPPAPDQPPASQHERGGQSFAELEANWRGLVTLTGGLSGYAPTEVKIQLGTLNGLLSSMHGHNGEFSKKDAALSEAQKDRFKGFLEEDMGLAALFIGVKTNVKGQYGNTSTQWAQVKGLRW